MPAVLASDEQPRQERKPDIEFLWQADLSGIRHGTYEEQAFQVPVGLRETATALVQEFDLYAAGEKKIQHGDIDGNILYEEPLLVWTYRGHLANDPASEVVLTFDTVGVYGTVSTGTRDVSFLPRDEAPMSNPASVPTSVSFEDETANDGPASGTGAGNACPTAGGAACDLLIDGRGTHNVAVASITTNLMPTAALEVALVKPYSEDNHQDDHPSTYAGRISNAYAQQTNMWRNEANIELTVASLYAATSDYGSSTCSSALSSFGSSHGTYSGVDAYQMFSGRDLSGCNGKAYIPSTSGTLATNRASILIDTDHSIWDYYDPDENNDRGLVSGQEIAHNWGERDHPQDRKKAGCGCYNIMASGTDHDNRGFWFTATTENYIIAATSGQF